jgi:hypothetical protein
MGLADLTPLDRLQPDIRPVRKSVIKSQKARGSNISRFELPKMESDRPTITVRQSVDGEDTLEFVCTCGCSTTVRLEYDPSVAGSQSGSARGETINSHQKQELQ